MLQYYSHAIFKYIPNFLTVCNPLLSYEYFVAIMLSLVKNVSEMCMLYVLCIALKYAIDLGLQDNICSLNTNLVVSCRFNSYMVTFLELPYYNTILMLFQIVTFYINPLLSYDISLQ